MTYKDRSVVDPKVQEVCHVQEHVVTGLPHPGQDA